MLYMLEIYVLIAITVFGIAGFIGLLSFLGLAVVRAVREPFVISRTTSRNRAA
jgi:hypothetical protein